MPTSLAPLLPAPPATIAEVVAPPVPAIEVPAVAGAIPDLEPASSPLTHAGLEAVAVEPEAVEPVVVEPVAVEPVAVEPVAVEPEAVEPVTVEPSTPESDLAERVMAEDPALTTEVPDLSPSTLDSPDEAGPRREPEIMVLARRAALPALAPLMAREVTLGDAARALRAALPAALTMTDGRQLRRAVAVGAATSVVAAAFAIRGRKHR